MWSTVGRLAVQPVARRAGAVKMRRAAPRLAQTATVLTVVVSAYLLLAPDPPHPGSIPDWVGHLGVFAVLGVAVGGVVVTRTRARVREVAAALLLLALYGAATEFAQRFTGRDPSLMDAAIDLAGAAPGLLLGYVASRRWLR